MNKYKEAKQYIDMIWSEPSWSRVDIDWLAIEQIKELVDRETPMKPNIRELSYPSGYKLYQYTCPTDFCVKLLSRGYRCKSCNQNIDWNNNDVYNN